MVGPPELTESSGKMHGMPDSGQDTSGPPKGGSRDNQGVAQVFADIATLLQLKDESVFKIRAYTRAAEEFERLPGQVATLARDEDLLKKIPWSAAAIVSKTHEPANLDQLRYGVGNARGGWMAKSDILNALPVAEYERLIATPKPGRASFVAGKAVAG